ncbi:hypothetical protein SDC9_117020 [bioreactor metagenome]|uniref:Uncharacterized protein n=2 Tax=root TaxID=1 RepID=A0A1W1IKG9_9LACT|nr:hypothetical protein [Trichococcus pasteurii]SFF10930.1 hypothetical protein SAMN04488086_12911 [Trichococcus pasteurii]SLM53339.1 Hypothetical protein TPAS_3067 [Trichococcus pasteurii]SSB94220.1 Hypothetical protein TPAS_3067 [Trichococcus pasteurii]
MKNFIKWESVVRYFTGKKIQRAKKPKQAEEIREASIITAAVD